MLGCVTRSFLPLGPDPSRRAFLVAVPVTAFGVALAGCSGDAPPSTGTDAAPGSTDTTTPKGSTADATGTQWPVYGHDFAQTRTNLAETAITRDNVADLAMTWEIPDLVGVTGTPTVADGIAHFCDWKGQVWAVRADTGEKVWTTMIGGMIVGAPAIDGDAVYASVGSMLYRINRATGEIEWEAATHDHPQAQISASPVVVDGIVLQGTASFENMIRAEEYRFRGSIGGFDTETGEQVWNFHATPDDDTAGAGAGIWSTPAVDTERGLLFVGTGQGLSEPTPPMADSLLAIDYRTGELRWSTQFTYPDVFSAANPTGKDADVGASPNLWTTDGRDLVGAGDKGGTYHALDRETGEVVWETQLTPGSAFGGEIGSAAFVDGTIVASSNVGDPETNAPTNVTHLFGLDPATGEKVWTSDELEGKIFAPVGAVPGVAFCGTDLGRMLALHTETGETLWSMDAPAPTACGPSVVDGRLLWGYGFTLFGDPGPGGILALEVPG
jgi:polyvinyl alcohol dehydrogenase (cytochrome)